MAALSSVPCRSPTVCQYCSSSYCDPRILDCLHSYCLRCITKIHKEAGTTNSSVVCPSCNHQTPIPDEGGIASLPANIRLEYETEQDGIVKKVIASPPPSCESCEKSFPSVAYCKDCNDMLCKECWKIHKDLRITKSHCTFSLDDLRKKARSELLKMISPSIPMCRHHDNQILNFYCTKCSIPVCVECSVDRHCRDDGHVVEEIDKHITRHKESIAGYVQGLPKKKNKLERIAEQINASKTEIQGRKNQTEDIIREAFAELRRSIDQREAELLSVNTRIASSKETRLTTQQEGIQQLTESIDRCLSVTSVAMSEYSNVQLLAIANTLHIRAIELQRQFTVTPLDPFDTPLITTSLNTTSLKNSLSQFGVVVDLSSDGHNCCAALPRRMLALGATMQVKVITRNKQKEVITVGGATVKCSLRHLSYNGGVVKDFSGITDNGNGTYLIDVTGQRLGQHHLSITVNGQNIQGSPFSLHLEPQHDYTRLNKPVQTITNSIHKPKFIAFANNGKLFVSTENRISVYDVSGGQNKLIHVSAFGSGNGNGELQFQVPSGLDIHSDVIYVAEKNNHRIQQLTVKGKFVGMFGEYGSAIGQFSNPYDVKISPDGMVYVADTDNHRIQVFSRNWHVSHVIDGTVSGNGHFEFPNCMAFDLSGNVHVCGHGSSSVVVFTSSGQFVRSYGDKGNIDGPWGIAIDSSGHCLVSSYQKSTLSVFDSKGKLLYTKCGFDYCRSIAISPVDGSLWVTNSYYECIKKY